MDFFGLCKHVHINIKTQLNNKEFNNSEIGVGDGKTHVYYVVSFITRPNLKFKNWGKSINRIKSMKTN